MGKSRDLASKEFITSSASVSAANNTAVTLFTLPDVAFATYILSVGLYADDVPNYHEVALVVTQGTSVAITTLNNASLITLSNSGLDIRGSQSSGITNTLRGFLTCLNVEV